MERFRRWLARLYFRVAFWIERDQLCDLDIEANEDGSRSLVIHRGSFAMTIPLDNDDRCSLASALMCPIADLKETEDYEEKP